MLRSTRGGFDDGCNLVPGHDQHFVLRQLDEALPEGVLCNLHGVGYGLEQLNQLRKTVISNSEEKVT